MTKVKKYYKSIDNLVDGKVDKIYSTTNYDMFKTLDYNRGEDKGIDTARLAKFKAIVEAGKFFFSWINVVINQAGIIIDGHHRFTMLKFLGLPVNFIITPEPEFNSTVMVELLGAIARLNAIDSKWNGTAHFNAAVKCGVQLAIEIKKVKVELDEEFGIDGKQITGGRIFTLLTENKKGLQSKLVSVEQYDNDLLIEVLNSAKFKAEIRFVYEIMSEAKKWNVLYKKTAKITGFKVIAAAMPKIWDNEMNMKKFLAAVKKYRFQDVADSWEGGRYYVQRLQKEILGLK